MSLECSMQFLANLFAVCLNTWYFAKQAVVNTYMAKGASLAGHSLPHRDLKCGLKVNQGH